MARREDHHHHHHHHQQQQQQQQRQIHYATIIPSNATSNTPIRNGHGSHQSSVTRKQTELERAKALYVDFEDAFQDETTNHDYFGFQPEHNHHSSERFQEDSDRPANFYLQSVETISEVKNANFSPFFRYHASRENSRPSTPSDTPPYQLRSYFRTDQNPSIPSSSIQNHRSSNSNSITNLNRDFPNLTLLNSNDIDDLPAPFSPDAVRIKLKQNKYDDSPVPSSEFKLILPQYFLVKYLGRTTCKQLWGASAVRSPIDDMVHSARQLSSMNEIPTLEACINTRGLTLTHRHSPVRNKHHSRSRSPDRQQHGLIPLEYISYVMHDLKYSKISACIVLRQTKSSASNSKTTNDTVTECYAFLFQSKEHAHRFALSLAEAFNAQKHSSRGAKQNHDDKREGRSPRRRSKHQNGAGGGHHHHERTRGKYDDSYLRDSEV